MDSRVRNLDGSVQSLCRPGCQRIYGDDHIRAGLFHHALDDLRSLHSRLSHNARLHAADLIHPIPVICRLAVLPHNMAGDAQIIHHMRPQRIGGHIAVSQTYHKNFLLLPRPGYDLGELPGKDVRHFPVKSLVRL